MGICIQSIPGIAASPSMAFVQGRTYVERGQEARSDPCGIQSIPGIAASPSMAPCGIQSIPGHKKGMQKHPFSMHNNRIS